jgi:GNAT superfamily N-acetyltransferase
VLATLILRDATPDDDDFMRRLYASTREAELSQLDWDAATRHAFLQMQFDARQRHFDQHFPTAHRQIIEVKGHPVGRLEVLRGAKAWRILDIALMTAFQGQGLGTRCLQAVLAEADALGLPLELHVDARNPARAWYERMGFITAPASLGSPGPYLAMRRPSTEQET